MQTNLTFIKEKGSKGNSLPAWADAQIGFFVQSIYLGI
jgi:hypothetical protein